MNDSLPSGITRTQDPGGRAAFRLDGPGGSAMIALSGAQVLSYRDAQGDVLWTASNSEYVPGKPVRGGVPLVFPWFGDHPTDKKLPAHGFARSLEWRLAEATAGPSIVLATQDDATTRALWPHPFALRFAIDLRAGLRMELTIHNTGSTPLRCEEALHTYFAVGDIQQASVHGLEGVPFTETASAPEAQWDQQQPLRFRAETDRVFHGAPDRLEVRAPALHRSITLQSTNARSAIVWNPWPAKTARLSQMAADDWQRFCCVESANCKQHVLELAPGEKHTLSLVITARQT